MEAKQIKYMTSAKGQMKWMTWNGSLNELLKKYDITGNPEKYIYIHYRGRQTKHYRAATGPKCKEPFAVYMWWKVRY